MYGRLEQFQELMKNPAVPKAFGTKYLIVRSYYFHIRSLSDSTQSAIKISVALGF